MRDPTIHNGLADALLDEGTLYRERTGVLSGSGPLVMGCAAPELVAQAGSFASVGVIM